MAKFQHLKRIFLIFTIILNLVSIFANWLLYADIVNIKPGLVFGPYSIIFQHSVLGLCILSTLINFLEVSSLYTELFKKDSPCWLDGHTTSALSIWLDDIPKAGIMLYIAACHDMAISVEEVVRAALLLCTLIIRFLVYVIRETCVRKRRSGLPTREEIRYEQRACRGCHFGFISLGLLVKLVAFLVIYFLTYFRVYPGGITYKIPTGLFKPTRNVVNYVENASIFAEVHSGMNNWGWFEIIPMATVVTHGKCLSTLKYDLNRTTVTNICSTCYNATHIIAKSPLHSTDSPKSVKFQFQFLSPKKSLLLGNIEYTVDTSGLEDKDVKLKYFCKDDKNYARNDVVGYMLGLVSVQEFNYTGSVPYGKKLEPMVSVPHCWRTGKLKCKMTGLDGPSHVQQLSVKE